MESFLQDEVSVPFLKAAVALKEIVTFILFSAVT